jgi:tripartite-type tricarboxylate transporter receptor subunit TctC
MSSKHTLTRRTLLGAAGAMALTAFSGGARAAEKWPARPIRLIVPYPPGGGTDTMSRLLADQLATDIKWTFVLDNRPGANGSIGMQLLEKAAPDGYTIGMGQTANLALNPWLYASLPYDPGAIQPIAVISSQPKVLVVSQKSKIRTLADFIAAAKAKPGELRHALSGSGSLGQMVCEMLGKRAGYKVLHVPYKGAAPSLTDVIAGTVDAMFSILPSSLSLINGGMLHPIAVSSKQRAPQLPNVPTIAESGFPGFEANDWKALAGPPNLPGEMARELNRVASEALRSANLIKRITAEGAVPGNSGDLAATAAFIAAERKRWGEIIRENNIKIR